jgi:uncharacterized protein (TIGR00299 family) protein
MIAYLDLPAGLSGDMFLGCLIDAGWSPDRLRNIIAALHLPAEEWHIDAHEVKKGPLRATWVDVQVQEVAHSRHLADIRLLLENADLPGAVKQRAIAVFQRLAAAEGKVHGMSIDDVHFHEVGAMDAIIDIVGTVAGLNELGIDRLYASAVPLGRGWANTAHGQIPLPAPATLELLASAKVPTCPAPGPGEHLTPTGAALLAEFATFKQPAITLSRIGIGAGQRDCAWPNVARLWLGEPQGDGGMVQLETNIDDMNPQLYSTVSDKLFAAGAKDVWFTPIHMKKNRPGILLSALAPMARETSLADVLLRETTTLGVRVHKVDHRHEASRESRQVETPFGVVRAKVKWLGSEPVGINPEYEDCRLLAETSAQPLRVVYEAAMASAQTLLSTLRDGVPGSARKL